MTTIPANLLDTVVTGDARDLSAAIPDESVDLVFTDPVYDRIEDYRWLAEECCRVLKPDRACIAWINNKTAPEVIASMRRLDFVATLCYVVPGSHVFLRAGTMFGWTKFALLFEKGRRLAYRTTRDTVLSTALPDGRHKWNKNELPIREWMEAFSLAGSVVWDPFTGGGTVPAVCKQLGRRYVAFEICAETAERARQRIHDTPMPLPFPDAPPPPALCFDAEEVTA